MATGETGFSDIVQDLITVQYHALKAGHNYDQFIRDAENADEGEIAEFFRTVMKEDADRARACHRYLAHLSGTPAAGSAVT
ncbi:acyl carrier protein [Frankia gtarii]|uniref:acyl carrier protein n=1 Tax=Frankia gtarii TaxID=2950102 RepID=UPI0021C0F6B0|nr:acyl carrier protein [Frankia gtarii]